MARKPEEVRELQPGVEQNIIHTSIHEASRYLQGEKPY